MWPKVIAQLFELMPHITRLVPMAEKYLTSNTSNKAAEATALALASDLRGDLTTSLATAHSGLQRELQEQTAQLTSLGEQVRLTQLAMEQREHRIEHLAKQVATLALTMRIVSGITLLLLVVILYLLLHHR